jgi:hypothetical protein
MTTRFQDIESYKLAAGLADELYTAARPWVQDDRTVLGLKLIEVPAQVGALIARTTGFEDEADIRAHIALVDFELSSLERLLLDEEAASLLPEPGRQRIAEIREALRRDFPRAA